MNFKNLHNASNLNIDRTRSLMLRQLFICLASHFSHPFLPHAPHHFSTLLQLSAFAFDVFVSVALNHLSDVKVNELSLKLIYASITTCLLISLYT